MKLLLSAIALATTQFAHAAVPDTVRFPSGDSRTELVGYVFRPAGAGPHPAVVMLHGRGGIWGQTRNSSAGSKFESDPNFRSLAMRHRMWGEFWASRGFVALLVDSFGPRGYPDGFPKHSYSQRPPEVSEQFVRPLDAYGALAYLRTRPDVVPDRVGIHGWSNGGMTLLSAIGIDTPGLREPDPVRGFRAALAQYPSCRTQLRQSDYRPYAPLLILSAAEDDEVSPEVCRQFSETMRARGRAVEFVVYPGAQHSYDDPGKSKQSHEPNRVAMQDSLKRAEAFFARHLKDQGVIQGSAKKE